MVGSTAQCYSPKNNFDSTAKKPEVRRKYSVNQSNKKYTELFTKKMRSTQKTAQLKRNLEETQNQEFELIQNKKLMTKGSKQRNLNVVDRFAKYGS